MYSLHQVIVKNISVEQNIETKQQKQVTITVTKQTLVKTDGERSDGESSRSSIAFEGSNEGTFDQSMFSETSNEDEMISASNDCSVSDESDSNVLTHNGGTNMDDDDDSDDSIVFLRDGDEDEESSGEEEENSGEEEECSEEAEESSGEEDKSSDEEDSIVFTEVPLDLKEHIIKSTSAKREKSVSFLENDILCQVFEIDYEYQRKGEWEEYARDRARFQRRILEAAKILNIILKPEHRRHVLEERMEADD